MKIEEVRARIECLHIACQITGASSFSYASVAPDGRAVKPPSADQVLKVANRLWSFAVPRGRKVDK